MKTTTDAVADVPPITHKESHGLARTAYDRIATAVETLGPDDWAKPTDCEGWDVRAMVGHLVGAMRSAASMRESMRQQKEFTKRAEADGGNAVDHMTALQIEITADLSTDALVTECRALVEPAAKGRKRTPAPMRRFVTFPVEMGSISEKWTLGYLVDVILTRDAWLHRVDLARATGKDLALTADHDGRVVADISAEWARRHATPCHLTLTGPAGGTFAFGNPGVDAPHVEIDAVAFCRILSGRAEPHADQPLLATEVPF